MEELEELRAKWRADMRELRRESRYLAAGLSRGADFGENKEEVLYILARDRVDRLRAEDALQLILRLEPSNVDGHQRVFDEVSGGGGGVSRRRRHLLPELSEHGGDFVDAVSVSVFVFVFVFLLLGFLLFLFLRRRRRRWFRGLRRLRRVREREADGYG